MAAQAVGFMSGTRQTRNSNRSYDFTMCFVRKTYFDAICTLKNTNYHKNYSFNVECSICRTNYLK